MKVILLQDIRGLGKKFDIREVSDGHARNFLIPKKLVKPATPSAVKELTTLKTTLEKEDSELKKHLTLLAERLKERSLTFYLKISEEGSVFGSVTKEMILKALREHKLITKERVDIAVDHPLKSIGEHEVAVDLKKGITAKIKVILRVEE